MLNPGPAHVQTVLEHLVAHPVLLLRRIQAHSGHHDSSGGFIGDQNATGQEVGFRLLLLVKIAATHSTRNNFRGMGQKRMRGLMGQAAVLSDQTMKVVDKNHPRAILDGKEQCRKLAGLALQQRHLLRTAIAEGRQRNNEYPQPVERHSNVNGRVGRKARLATKTDCDAVSLGLETVGETATG